MGELEDPVAGSDRLAFAERFDDLCPEQAAVLDSVAVSAGGIEVEDFGEGEDVVLAGAGVTVEDAPGGVEPVPACAVPVVVVDLVGGVAAEGAVGKRIRDEQLAGDEADLAGDGAEGELG